MPKLVIVESPAKAKTIGKYLGRGYKVTASMGHVRDLPASTLGIDVENGYTPKYITIKGKQKLVKELKAEAKKCDGVLLATDPDREGEAISWHLANILGLDPSAPNRVTFDEITKKGVKEGMAHPLVKDTGGLCPLDGGHMLVRKSAKGRVYYGCSNYPKCNYMTWDEPVPEKCPQCGSTLFKKKGQLYCAKEGCGFVKAIEKK